jgi:hypothetical protein
MTLSRTSPQQQLSERAGLRYHHYQHRCQSPRHSNKAGKRNRGAMSERRRSGSPCLQKTCFFRWKTQEDRNFKVKKDLEELSNILFLSRGFFSVFIYFLILCEWWRERERRGDRPRWPWVSQRGSMKGPSDHDTLALTVPGLASPSVSQVTHRAKDREQPGELFCQELRMSSCLQDFSKLSFSKVSRPCFWKSCVFGDHERRPVSLFPGHSSHVTHGYIKK